MKFVFLLLLIAGAAFIGYPLLNEDASSQCSALERRLITITQQAENRALLGVLQSSLSNGSVVAAAAKQKYPNLPTALTCAATYWQTVFNSSGQTQLWPRRREGLDDAVQALTPAAEAQKAMRALQNPGGAGGSDTTVIKPNHSPTYRPAEKRELDRVIGTQR